MKHMEIFNTKLKQINDSTEKYFKSAEDYCNNIDIPNLDDLSVFKNLYANLEKQLQIVKGIRVDFNINSIQDIINNDFSRKLKNVEIEKNNLMVTLRDKVENRIEEKRNIIRNKNLEIRAKNDALRAEIDAANSRYRKLELKRQRLLEYSNEILQLCSDNGIKVSDINITNDMFSIDELELFYEQFYSFISSRSKINPITWIREKTNDNAMSLSFILLMAFMMVFTPVLDTLAVVLLLYIIYCQSIQEGLVKKYTIMAGLAFNINPMELGIIKEIPEDLLEDELSEEIDIDSDPDFKELYDEINKRMNDITDEDIRTDRSNALASYTMDYPKMENALKNTLDKVENRRRMVASIVNKTIDELKDKEKELKSKVKLLGDEFSEEFIINTSVKLGINKDTLIYETIDIGSKNIVFKESGNNKNDLDSFIKVMLTNYYCNVRPGYFDVTVYDPNGLGRSLAGFYNPDLEQLFRISTDNLEAIIKELKEHTDRVIKLTKGATVSEYNAMASKVGKTCINYKLLLILSQPKTIEENEALRSFVEYSADLGVFVWIVGDNEFPNTHVFNKPFEGIKEPITIDRNEFPVHVTDNLFKAFNALKSPSLLWEDFKNIAIPDKDIWSYNADEFIQLDPGFEEGDPSKFRGYTVGNTGDIHSLCVGGTGAGKSVFINNIIANICTKYSPKDVELWLVDFKGSEFNFYLKNPTIGQNYMLPHIKACLCTSDPDYSVSLFKALRDEADSRYKFLMAEGFKNMYEFNKSMRKQGRAERCLKRTLVIADEFQVIFEKTDAKAQDQLKKDITQIAKVARACGIHLFFCSQSMKGTVSDDILSQFTLRFGLRCPMDVSLAVMGTKFSGEIREKNGYLYVSSIDDKKKELQKRYRTPFIPDKSLRDRINMLAEKAIKERFERESEAITYDETTIHNIEEVDALYENVLKGVDVNNLFILGERMVYSERGRRSNIILSRENNQHIFSVFSNTSDAVMFFNTLMENLKYNGECMKIFNSQVKDLGYLCHVDELIDKDNAIFYDEEQTPSTLLPVFQKIVETRKQAEDPNKLKPLYIFLLGWDKSVGFGIDSNYKLTDGYSTLLQTCGTANVHFIFITSSQGEIPKSIVMAANHRIAGKCDEKSSTTLLDSNAAYKNYDQDNGYMFLFSSGRVERLKIYRSELTRTIKEKELRI